MIIYRQLELYEVFPSCQGRVVSQTAPHAPYNILQCFYFLHYVPKSGLTALGQRSFNLLHLMVEKCEGVDHKI
ncbi:hypothetical protein KY290_024752 [Solanum tuberosum]|uniref:Uncharacterized protein n=1 Tax=Solanum tuberosum TaxID=4113 RepID=A0ABQ7URK5_SOLTU|nr:hypothetical protein KY284_023610 [Solanum tuberosum]KAH0754482.1 hypothetical protein KY290_024752 [Solanum tuberosum]